MRDNARVKKSTTIKEVHGYHHSSFESLKFFNSDRVINITSDYKVSENNTASTLRIAKVGSDIQSYGNEIELTCSTINDSTVLANILDLVYTRCFPSDFIRMEHDGSLYSSTSLSSAECVTQTYSKAWMRNNYAGFQAMFEYFSQFGITPGDTCCGMHVNIGLANFGKTKEAQDVAIRKFWYLVANNYSLMKVLVRREEETTYCGNVDIRNKEDVKAMDLNSMSSSHYYCMNYSHYREGRIEFRLVGGQKNFKAFRNTMEVVFWLVDVSKRLSWSDLDDLVKVFSGCNQYVLDRLSRAVDRNELDMTTYNKISAKAIEEDFEIR